MPYKSLKQERFFHTATARRKGISAATVKEFDQASKGMKLPKYAKEDREFVRRVKKSRGKSYQKLS